jgi:cephalosporin hydroxylase
MNFINQESSKINGWFFHPDMISFWCIDLAQKQMQIMGDLCEVGVWHGKSIVLLCNLAREGETITGFDLFEGDLLDKANKNIQLYGGGREAILKVADTSRLNTTELGTTFSRGIRILHIDAGHEYHEVMHQLQLFSPFVSEGGCIIMDDYQDREFPGIEAAVLDFCEIDRPRRFVPFLAGGNKMYLCERNMATKYQTNLLQHDVFADKSRTTRVRDFTVLVGFSKLPITRKACLDSLPSLPFLYDDTATTPNLSAYAIKYAQRQQDDVQILN